jgi:putative SOS response-associated peptidase YedK
MWRHPFRQARCLIPAEGWYEWQKVPQVDSETGEIKESKQPHYIYRKDGSPFCFAGLMSFWTPPGKPDPVLSCTILTRAASARVAKVHDRMPVVLPDAVHDDWLEPELTDAAKVAALVRDCAVEDFSHHPVSTRVNSPKNRDAALLDPVE